MNQLKRIVSTALTQTAALWKPIATAFDWVHQVATILENDAQLDGYNVRYTLELLLQAMERCKAQAGSLATGIDHFLRGCLKSGLGSKKAHSV